uniref:Uncharacterized protein n=1 Tax=Ditylenchus dipsaci TaxID=166011 RepID=A0A915DAQ4_9BILA
MHVDQHEGKLSFARSKEVSNSRLFNLGKRRKIPFLMEASKIRPSLELDETDEQGNSFNDNSSLTPRKDNEHSGTGWGEVNNGTENYKCEDGVEVITFSQNTKTEGSDLPPLPYNMLTQQYVSDKSIADCVEALIGAHLVALGPRAALKFMSWLGVKVLTETPPFFQPLLRFIDTEAEPDRSQRQLYKLYIQFKLDQVEEAIDYRFGNKAYLLQAFTHASYYKNQITGCYQRLEFLGDAVLDYLITRFLFEHEKQYSPGVCKIQLSQAFHCNLSWTVSYDRKICQLMQFKTGPNDHCTNFDDEMFMITEDEIDEGHEEDIEVPKALGDIFESIAGAVYLDCGMNLDIVWRVFYNLMKDIRELFERKNCKARFTKLERILETGKVRVTVDVNDMRFVGMGRSYRIAKCTAAKRALKHLRALDYAKGLNKK